MESEGNKIISEEVIDVLGECYRDMAVFCRTLLPDNFYKPFSSLHQIILKKMDEKRPRKKTVICGTRGIGKTSLATAKAAKHILFAESDFIVYVSMSATHAEMQTENLKKDLMSGDIMDLFGKVNAKTVNEVEESWSRKTWVATVGAGDKKHYTLVLPRGAGQQIRGLRWKSPSGKSCRPDLIIIDDLEDPDLINNLDNRKKLKDWFFGDVMRCFNLLDQDWEMFYIDTLKHDDSLMATLLEASDWDKTTVAICDDNYKSLAPEFMSDIDIMKDVESYREKGLLDVFAREVMCKSIAKEDAIFRPEFFKYYEENEQWFKELIPSLINVVLVDPAKTAKASSAETGFIVWGIDLIGGRLFLRYAAGERIHQDEQINRALELCRLFNARVLGVECTGSGEYVTYPYMNAAIQARMAIEVIPLTAKAGKGEFSGPGGGKLMRISTMAVYYRTGKVYHNKTTSGQMEMQLLTFPRGKRVDVIDAAAYITEMLDIGGRFFMPADVGLESREDVEKEYAEVLEDEPLDDSWRTSP